MTLDEPTDDRRIIRIEAYVVIRGERHDGAFLVFADEWDEMHNVKRLAKVKEAAVGRIAVDGWGWEAAERTPAAER